MDKAAELKAEYNKSLESNDADEEVCVSFINCLSFFFSLYNGVLSPKMIWWLFQEEDEEKQSDDDAEEKKADDANEAEENEVVNKEPDGKEEAEDEILDDY